MRTDEDARRRPNANIVKQGYSYDPIVLRTAVHLRRNNAGGHGMLVPIVSPYHLS